MKIIFSKVKIISASALFAVAAFHQASAATITFGGQNATDGSGITSSLVDPSNILDGSTGFFVQTFDDDTKTVGAPPGIKDFNDPGFDTCALNGSASGIEVKTSGSLALAIRQGNKTNVAAAPLNDSTCYAYTPAEGGATPSWAEIDYSAFLKTQGDVGITYLGFYWGSVDIYNDFDFYSGNTLLNSITGSELLAALNGQSGNQNSESSNQYVNIDFTFADAFDRVRITSSGIAGEFDNIVLGLKNRPVPAPAGLAFLIIGLLGLRLSKR